MGIAQATQTTETSLFTISHYWYDGTRCVLRTIPWDRTPLIYSQNSTTVSWSSTEPARAPVLFELCKLCFSKQINKKTLFYSPRKRAHMVPARAQKPTQLRIAKPMAIKRVVWTGVNFKKTK